MQPAGYFFIIQLSNSRFDLTNLPEQAILYRHLILSCHKISVQPGNWRGPVPTIRHSRGDILPRAVRPEAALRKRR